MEKTPKLGVKLVASSLLGFGALFGLFSYVESNDPSAAEQQKNIEICANGLGATALFMTTEQIPEECIIPTTWTRDNQSGETEYLVPSGEDYASDATIYEAEESSKILFSVMGGFSVAMGVGTIMVLRGNPFEALEVKIPESS